MGPVARIKSYFQLVRLPNLFTAAADSLAGWLLVRGSFTEPARWLPLCGASMAIYAGGIALNDVFDLEIDRADRPGRPLPSGRVSKRFAAILAGILLAAGPVLALAAGTMQAIVAAILAGCVLLYDAGMKRTPFGPLVMGACRGLNLLMGLAAIESLGGPPGWSAAGALALFVVGLTVISRSETESGRSSGVVAGMAIQDLALCGLFGVAIFARKFPLAADRPILPVEGLLALGLVALVVNLADGRAVTDPRPGTIQNAVKTGVLSLVWLDVALVAAVRGPGPALAVASLWVPAFALGKWLYST